MIAPLLILTIVVPVSSGEFMLDFEWRAGKRRAISCGQHDNSCRAQNSPLR